MSNFVKSVDSNEDSEFSDDSSQSYDSDMSPENISRPISLESEVTALRHKVILRGTWTMQEQRPRT